MRSALAHSATAILAIAGTPTFGLDATDLKYAAIELQRQIDQLTAQQSRVIFEADRTGAWKGSAPATWRTGSPGRPRPPTAQRRRSSRSARR